MAGAESRYEIIDRVATGGMAEVFRARALREPGSPVVVIKKILPNLSANAAFQRMFMDEARIAAALQHPNIARLIDLGRMGDQLFIALEYVEGLSAEQLLALSRERRIRIPIDAAIYIVREVLQALHHAHTRLGADGKPLGIVHRDVSPGNVLLSTEGAVKLSDFGLAKASMRDGQTVAGVVRGNVRFMAPEQIYGSQVDARTDVYGAGMLLFTLLAGRSPFENDPLPAIHEKIVKGEIPLPSALNPDVPAPLDQIVEKATKISPRLRFLSAESLADALEEFGRDHRVEPSAGSLLAFLEEIDDEPVAQGKPSIVARLGPLIADAVGTDSLTPGRVKNPDPVPAAPELRSTTRGRKKKKEREPDRDRDRERNSTTQGAIHMPRDGILRVRPVARMFAHKQTVSAVALAPNGKIGYSASYDHTVISWDLVTQLPVKTMTGHKNAIVAMALSNDGRVLVTGSRDKSTRVWDATTGAALGTLAGHEGWVFSVAISHDGRTLITGSVDRTVRLWDLTWRKAIVTLEGHTDSVSAVAFSPDDRWALSGSYDGSIKTWDLAKFNEIRSFPGAMESIRAAAISPDGATALAAGADATLRLWDLTWGTEVVAYAGHREPVVAVAVSPDGARALSASYDGTMRLWSVADGRCLAELTSGEPVLSVCFAADGRSALSGGADGAVSIWELP